LVFKRRDKRPMWKVVADLLWPKGGWVRAYHYVRHRIRRLPDPPHRIARGIFAGVFISFTPLFGFHFIGAITLARLMQGNIIAALMATFFGNPVTFVFIAMSSMTTGSWLLGLGDVDPDVVQRSFMGKFVDAGHDLKYNLMTLFKGGEADWTHLSLFYDQIFYPYLIGSIIPGIIAGTVMYYLSVPLITAYQKRRASRIQKKMKARREKLQRLADAARKAD